MATTSTEPPPPQSPPSSDAPTALDLAADAPAAPPAVDTAKEAPDNTNADAGEPNKVSAPTTATAVVSEPAATTNPMATTSTTTAPAAAQAPAEKKTAPAPAAPAAVAAPIQTVGEDGIDDVNPHDFKGEVDANNELPSPLTLQRIENYVVLDRHGKSHTFKSLYSGRNVARRVLIIFVRHFFCGNCQEYLRSLSASITPENLLRLPISTFIAVVGCGDPGLIDMYVKETGCPFPVYADPTRRLYDELGMVRTLALGSRPAYMRKSMLLSSLKSIVQGLRQIPTGMVTKAGDQRQIGGEFLFEPLSVLTPLDEVDKRIGDHRDFYHGIATQQLQQQEEEQKKAAAKEAADSGGGGKDGDGADSGVPVAVDADATTTGQTATATTTTTNSDTFAPPPPAVTTAAAAPASPAILAPPPPHQEVGVEDEAEVEEKRVTWCHRMRTTRDHAEIPELMEVLGLDGQGNPRIKSSSKRWSRALESRKGTGLSMASQISAMKADAEAQARAEEVAGAEEAVARARARDEEIAKGDRAKEKEVVAGGGGGGLNGA